MFGENCLNHEERRHLVFQYLINILSQQGHKLWQWLYFLNVKKPSLSSGTDELWNFYLVSSLIIKKILVCKVFFTQSKWSERKTERSFVNTVSYARLLFLRKIWGPNSSEYYGESLLFCDDKLQAINPRRHWHLYFIPKITSIKFCGKKDVRRIKFWSVYVSKIILLFWL